MITREECLTLDNADPLRSYRQRFVLPEHLIYLDGNSLGPMARGVKERVVDAMEQG